MPSGYWSLVFHFCFFHFLLSGLAGPSAALPSKLFSNIFPGIAWSLHLATGPRLVVLSGGRVWLNGSLALPIWFLREQAPIPLFLCPREQPWRWASSDSGGALGVRIRFRANTPRVFALFGGAQGGRVVFGLVLGRPRWAWLPCMVCLAAFLPFGGMFSVFTG